MHGCDGSATRQWVRTIDIRSVGSGRDPYDTMGVVPSTQPVATFGPSFMLSSFDFCKSCVRYVEATVFDVGCDNTIPLDACAWLPFLAYATRHVILIGVYFLFILFF